MRRTIRHVRLEGHLTTAPGSASCQTFERPLHGSTIRKVSLWQVYRFSYTLALRTLSRKHLRTAAQLLLEPCTYWRNLEIPAVINNLEIRPGDKILDIGSPKLASLFIWHSLGAEVYATDLFPYFVEVYSHLSAGLRDACCASGYHIAIQDARALDYPESYFDRVYAVSVVEHIEDHGDSQAMREIARVLKPGGICCLTVPASAAYREDMVETQLYYKDSSPGHPVFWQRRYDPAALESRIVAPSGLRLMGTEYYGERGIPYERLSEDLPFMMKVLLAPLGSLASKLFLVRLEPERASSAKAVLLKLRKDDPFQMSC